MAARGEQSGLLHTHTATGASTDQVVAGPIDALYFEIIISGVSTMILQQQVAETDVWVTVAPLNVATGAVVASVSGTAILRVDTPAGRYRSNCTVFTSGTAAVHWDKGANKS